MSSSRHISRRDFVKLSTAVLGSVISAVIGIPAIGYLIAPALREDKAGKPVVVGNLKDIPVGKPFPFSFTVTKVNGWERTASTFGGFVIRKSEAKDDILVLSSRCTHLSCRVNWQEAREVFVCPCHDANFSLDGKVLNGPPPMPLGKFDYQVQDDGTLVIIPVELLQEA